MQERKIHDLFDLFSQELGNAQYELYRGYETLIEEFRSRVDVRGLLFIETDLIYLMSKVQNAIQISTDVLPQMQEANKGIAEEFSIN